MSDLKPKPITIELGGKEYGLLFSINVIDEIQDKFDIPISGLPELLKDERQVFKILRFLFTIMINEAIDDSESGEPHVDEKFVGRKITVFDIPQLKDKVFGAFANGMPKDEDIDPNAKSE